MQSAEKSRPRRCSAAGPAASPPSLADAPSPSRQKYFLVQDTSPGGDVEQPLLRNARRNPRSSGDCDNCVHRSVEQDPVGYASVENDPVGYAPVQKGPVGCTSDDKDPAAKYRDLKDPVEKHPLEKYGITKGTIDETCGTEGERRHQAAAASQGRLLPLTGRPEIDGTTDVRKKMIIHGEQTILWAGLKSSNER